VIRPRPWRGRAPLIAAAGLALVTVLPAVATAHPDHGGGEELFPGEGVVADGGKQHEGDEGHLPPVHRGPVELVGKGEVTNPSGAGNTGRVGDVTGYGDFAYLTAYAEPTCQAGGVHVMDISDPANPVEVRDAFIPTSPGSFAGEGIQVVRMDNESFTGDLLVHNNETCDPAQIIDPAKAGGISLWDVSNPRDPQPVTLHTGDFTNPSGVPDPAPNQTHSMRVWTNVFDGRTYVVLVDDEEATDVDILDITDPRNPVLVNDTLDLAAQFGVDQADPANLTQVFSHDMDVYKIGQRYVMNVSYWDGGYVLLDVTDPRPGQVSLIAESDFAALDEQRLARGQEISPEGNAHQSELSPNRRFLIGTDEDFAPFRVQGTIDSGTYSGTSYPVVPASGAAQVTPDAPIAGPTTAVGLGCDPATVPAGSGTALVERGVCPFQTKLDNVMAQGYSAGIVFNSMQPDCMTLVNMAAEGEIPFVFVSRLTGLQLLGAPGVTEQNACSTPAPAGSSEATTINAVFDGWGYVRLFGTDIPRQRGATGSISQIDTYSVPEAQDPAHASGSGDLSVHEVAMDPDTQGVAYLSYYAAGLRVVEYGRDGIEEVAAFIDEGGNNFWGVEVWYDERGAEYVLASDRDFGLYVFRYPPADRPGGHGTP
jgi:hypothetical protein